MGIVLVQWKYDEGGVNKAGRCGSVRQIIITYLTLPYLGIELQKYCNKLLPISDALERSL